MITRLLLALTLAGALHAVAASADYDLFSGAQYPGGIKKPGVDLYKVKQKGGRYAEGYQRRPGHNTRAASRSRALTFTR